MTRTARFERGVGFSLSRPALHFFLGCLLCALAASAQTISTYAGNDAIFAGTGLQATAVPIVGPVGVALDGQGNMYVSAPSLAMVLKVAPNGVITVAAGNGLAGSAGNGGPAVAASLYNPQGVAVDPAGNLYIADAGNQRIRRVDTSGIITKVAGNGQSTDSGDGGPATNAGVANPWALAVDSAGNLYISEVGQKIRKVTPDGTISTFAGTGAGGYSGDGGLATQATFQRPLQVAFDGAGNVYVADQDNGAIRKISTSGIITTVAGGKWGYSGDGGPAKAAALKGPRGIAVDSTGILYIADSLNERIRRVDLTGTITTVAGTGNPGFSGDGGPALQALFSTPGAIEIDSTGALVAIDGDNNRVRRVVVGGAVNTIAGETLLIGDNGPAPLAVLPSPQELATDSAGNLYIAVNNQNRIRKVAPSGIITTVAGNGATGNNANGLPATAATMNNPNGVAVDPSGNIFIAESGDNAIRRVDAVTGQITTFAGNNGCCYQGNGSGGDGGSATSAVLYFPTSVAVDKTGNVYMTNLVELPSGVDQGARVRRVTPDGKINVYAGGGYGFGGDGGQATAALMGSSLSIATGPDGSLYIVDKDNNRVRRVDPATGIVTTVAGNGNSPASGDGGQATAAGMAPQSVTVDAANNLYIGCRGYVRKVTPDGTIVTYMGNGVSNYAGDGGPALAASIPAAYDVAVDASGNLFISDSSDNRVRVVQAATSTLTVSPVSLTFTSTGATSQTFTVTSSGAAALAWAASASTTSGGNWLAVSPATGAGGATVTVTVSLSGLASGDYYGSIEVTSGDASDPVEFVTVRLTVGTAGATPPAVAAGGVLSSASYSLNTPVAPGMLVSIFGTNLTEAGQVYPATSFPWPTQMGGTSVTIGGEPMPLYVVTPGQINAMLPFDLAANTTLPVVVTYNGMVSAPVPVGVVASEPGMFTLAQNGAGTGVVIIVHPDGSQVLAGGGNAAQAGDVLVIWATGLGAVTPRAVAGAPVVLSPLSWANDPVSVTIGGVNAPGVQFDGAAPGWAGLYQVNVTVPPGITPSAQAPLILTQSGRSSPALATIPTK